MSTVETRYASKLQIKIYRDEKRAELKEQTGLSLREQKYIRGTIRKWRKARPQSRIRSIYGLINPEKPLSASDREFRDSMFKVDPLKKYFNDAKNT